MKRSDGGSRYHGRNRVWLENEHWKVRIHALVDSIHITHGLWNKEVMLVVDIMDGIEHTVRSILDIGR